MDLFASYPWILFWALVSAECGLRLFLRLRFKGGRRLLSVQSVVNTYFILLMLCFVLPIALATSVAFWGVLTVAIIAGMFIFMKDPDARLGLWLAALVNLLVLVALNLFNAREIATVLTVASFPLGFFAGLLFCRGAQASCTNSSATR